MKNPNIIEERAIRPLENKIMVKPIKPEKVTRGGIIIPDTVKNPPLMGIVMAAGPGRHVENPVSDYCYIALGYIIGCLDLIAEKMGRPGSFPVRPVFPTSFIPNPVKVGDKVLFHKFSGNEVIDNDNNTVVLMCSDDVLGILDRDVSHCYCICHKIPGAEKKVAHAHS